MKINRKLLSIAVVYNVVNFLFWLHISNMSNATSMIYMVIFPCFWIVTIVFVVMLSLKNKIIWFQREYNVSTIISLFFCTPILFLSFIAINSPESYRASSSCGNKNGFTVKRESWNYSDGGRQVVKYWKANELGCCECDSLRLKKDSVWIYFDKKGDTIKVESYDYGKLIEVRN
jgi:hypothetical protein